jgi:all-trans-retinol dehydrogenase (NAD+)
MRTLKDTRVLITGAASGIGRSIAERCAQQGAVVVLTDIDETLLQETARQMREAGYRVHAHRLDVTDAEDVAAVRERVHAEGGPVDVLVNNAGTVFGGYFLDVPLARHVTTLEVNLLGVVIVTHAFLPDLIDRPDAHLVNIASVAGYGGAVRGSTYASSKWGVIGFSESMELELKEQGNSHVHVTTVCPGVVSTGLFEGAAPLRLTRILTPEDVASSVVDGILRNASYVRTPWLAKLAPVLRGVLPHRAFNTVLGIFGGSATMDNWTGRVGGSTPSGPAPQAGAAASARP